MSQEKQNVGTPVPAGRPEDDALGEDLKANYTEQTEFEAKEVPGACKKAVDKQTKTDGVDDTIRTPSNTPGCNK